MANYKIPEWLKKKARDKVKTNEETRERDKNKYPGCAGTFPDPGCINATKDKPGEDCAKCPHFK